MKYYCFFLLIISFGVTYGQSSVLEDFDLKPYNLPIDSLGDINFYVTENGLEKSKRFLILLDGSRPLPLYSLVKKADGSKQISKTVLFKYNLLSEIYHVVLISKPGTPFMDSLNVESYRELVGKYKPSNTYNEKLSLEWRAKSVSAIIKYLVKNIPVSGDVIVISYSEGGQVVSKLAAINNKVTKIVNVVGGGLINLTTS